jgi:hypothetical protein
MAQEMTIGADIQEDLSTPEGRVRFLSRTEPEDPVAYDKWFRAQVQEAMDTMDDPDQLVPHEQVMAELHALIEAKQRARAQMA